MTDRANWHADITFEPIPSDYAILKVHTLPTINGSTPGAYYQIQLGLAYRF